MNRLYWNNLEEKNPLIAGIFLMNVNQPKCEDQVPTYEELISKERTCPFIDRLAREDAGRHAPDMESLREYGVPEEKIDELLENERRQAESFVGEKRDNFVSALKNAELQEKVRIDKLTGVHSKIAYEEQIGTHLKLAKRQDQKNKKKVKEGKEIEPSKLSVLMLDIDKFKRVNDILGHNAGDIILTLAGKVMRDTVRESDFPARYGGEEFVIIFPQTNGESMTGAKRLRKAMQKALKPELDILLDKLVETEGIEALFEPAKELGILEGMGIKEGSEKKFQQLNGNQRVRLYPMIKDSLLGTISIGIATYKEGDNEETLRIRADKALFNAKHGGRNRVVNANEKTKSEINMNQETAEAIETTLDKTDPMAIANEIQEALKTGDPEKIADAVKPVIPKDPEERRRFMDRRVV